MLDLRRETKRRSYWRDAITILMFACMHGHLRKDARLTPIVIRHAVQGFEVITPEPNLDPPLTTGEMVKGYEDYLRIGFEEAGDGSQRLVMILYVTPDTSAEVVERAYALGIRVVKLYYKVTTNSAHGVTHWREAETAIAAMEAICLRHPHDPMFLQVHAEALGHPHHAREAACIVDMEELTAAHPDLWVAIEHVTTRLMLEFVARHPKVGASITLHHLVLTWDDDCVQDWDDCEEHDPAAPDETSGEPRKRLRGHRFCAPVVKTEDDRQALLDAVFGKVPGLVGKVWLGLDFAPHPLEFKDGPWTWPPQEGKPLPRMGMYTLDVAVPLLVALFERYGGRDWIKKLEKFASTNGPLWYRIPPPSMRMTVVRQSSQVPEFYADADGVPLLRSFIAGQTVDWEITETRMAA